MRSFLLFSLLLAACSKAPETSTQAVQANNPTAQTLVKVENAPSLVAALDVVATSSLSCADSSQCPSGVGMLLAADEAGGFAPDSNAIAACTAVLVGDDLVLTNSHCIPSAVKLLPDLCASRVKVAFAGTENLPAESIPCAGIVGFSKRETPASPDLALLRLARKSGRGALPVDLSGVEPESQLRSYRVNPDLKHRAGSLVSGVCHAAAGSYRMPVYETAQSSVAVVGDCDAIPGNSGSPLVRQDGRLVALLQATLPLSPAAQTLWGQHADEPFTPLAMGTSLRCLTADPATGSFAWNAECTTIEDGDVAAARPTISGLIDQEPLAQETAALLAPFLGQTSAVHLERQTLSGTALDRRETLSAVCADGALPNLQVPTYSISLRFNRYLQLIPARLVVESVGPLATPAEDAAPLPLCQESGKP